MKNQIEGAIVEVIDDNTLEIAVASRQIESQFQCKPSEFITLTTKKFFEFYPEYTNHSEMLGKNIVCDIKMRDEKGYLITEKITFI